MAFDPDYESNRRFYVYYTPTAATSRSTSSSAAPATRCARASGRAQKVIKIAHDQADNHNGGQLQFGPDGYLYAAHRRRRPAGGPRERRPGHRTSLLGKLLRIEPLRQRRLHRPARQPLRRRRRGRDEIFALGPAQPVALLLRLGDRRAHASATSAAATARRSTIEARPAASGANFGWNDYEGFVETAFGTGAERQPAHRADRRLHHGPPRQLLLDRRRLRRPRPRPARRSRASTSSPTSATARSQALAGPRRAPPATTRRLGRQPRLVRRGRGRPDLRRRPRRRGLPARAAVSRGRAQPWRPPPALAVALVGASAGGRARRARLRRRARRGRRRPEPADLHRVRARA